jgi:chemotaxis signal transduction protein
MSGIHVRVRAGGEQYALPVDSVREIAEMAEIAPVPGAPAGVLGVWNLRGDVLAALDLAALLGLEPAAEPSRIVVAENGEARAGLVVESVARVGALPEAREPADSHFLSASALVDGAPLGILDLDALLGAVGEGAG